MGVGRPLRVLHCPDAVGAHPPTLARAERELGLASWSVAAAPPAFGYEVDEVLRGDGVGRVRYELRRLDLLRRALADFDVVHFNFGRTILPTPPTAPARVGTRVYAALSSFADLRLLRAAGKAVFVTFQGDDVRQGDVLRSAYDRSLASESPATYSDAGDRAKRRIVAAFDRCADGIFYLNPDLARVLPRRAEFLPYASVDPREWRPVEARADGPFRVVHAPSDPAAKGTRYVVQAVDALRAEGLPVELALVEGLPRRAVRAVYERADLVVDQLVAGWYGGAAVEAMALGKPVGCYIRDADLGAVPPGLVRELPVLRAEPATLAAVVRRAWEEPERLREVGRRSRAFVERWHDPAAVARRTAAAYAAAVGARQDRPGRRAPGSASRRAARRV